MTCLSDYADKTVLTIEPSRTDHGVSSSFAKIRFSDGDSMSIYIAGREFYDNKGARIDRNDFDAVFIDCFSPCGVIRTPQPPRWREPKDQVLRHIISEFKFLEQTLMRLCGERHHGLDRKPYAERWEEATGRWSRTVRGYYGYDRRIPSTHPAPPIQPPPLTLLERFMTWLKPKPSNPYERDRK